VTTGKALVCTAQIHQVHISNISNLCIAFVVDNLNGLCVFVKKEKLPTGKLLPLENLQVVQNVLMCNYAVFLLFYLYFFNPCI
jgi:hypothetical protein